MSVLEVVGGTPLSLIGKEAGDEVCNPIPDHRGMYVGECVHV